MAESLAADPGARVATWYFDETMRGGFYLYCGLVFPAISDTSELEQVLAGQHESWNGVLALNRAFPPGWAELPPWHIRDEIGMGSKSRWLSRDRLQRRLLWIEGLADP